MSTIRRYIVGADFTLTTPNHPDKYPHNSECWYHVQRKSDGHCGVVLTVDSFHLEAASCMFDYLEVNRQRVCGYKQKGDKCKSRQSR